ncbi:MAG: YhgN family NAAT transporter [Rhodobacteraceae bacterium]|nr:YhgN family NAAT transporter [Paracoccaceae bacterium]
MEILSAALLLFLIMDPLGNVPLFLAVLKDLPERRRRVVMARELLIALATLMVFVWFGRYLLQALHLGAEAVTIAGGIILFIIGIRMIFPPADGIFGETPDGEPFIVPLAIPSIAGPSSMAALLLLGHDNPARNMDWSLALLLAWSGCAAILWSSTALYRLLGRRALVAMERLMGMLLVAMSVQMLLDGIARYLGTLG